jgi:flavin-dependent dehydrogenase/8-oxo-dGTP pyrophosphatase MutT (NUDIX family)
LKQKVLAYVFRTKNNIKEILVFDHKNNSKINPQVIAGSVDDNETCEAAIIREIKEESGLVLEEGFKLGEFSYFREDIKEKQKRHIFCFNIENDRDSWTHIVSSGVEDKGKEFSFYWLPINTAKNQLVAQMGKYLEPENDITIIGGGMSSTLLAIQTKRLNPSLNISILESSFPGEMEQKVGESTSDLTAIFLRRFGIDHLLEKHIQKSGLRFIFKSKFNTYSEFSSPSYKSVANGLQIDRKVFDEDLLEYAQNLGIRVLRSSRYINFSQHNPLDSIVFYKDLIGENLLCIKTKWIIDATGRKGLITKKLDWRKDVDDLNTAASWGYYEKEEKNSWDPIVNKKWNDYSIGNKSESTTHLLGEGYWAWHFPINNSKLSFGIVYDKNTFIDKDPKKVYSYIISKNEALANMLSKKEISEFKHLNSLSYKSKQIVKAGFASIGDATAFVDPLFSPGMEIITEQTLSLSRLLSEDLMYKKEKKWKSYEKDLIQSIETRIFLYEDRYKVMGEYDLFTNWTHLDFFGYYTFHVLPSVYFPRLIENTPKFNFVTKLLYKLYKNRILYIMKLRKNSDQLYKSKQDLKFSRLLIPNIKLAPFKVIELFFLWLIQYMMIEIKHLKNNLLK